MPIGSVSDPLFIADRSRMTDFQEKFEVDYELRGRLESDGSAVALNSLNCHDSPSVPRSTSGCRTAPRAHSVCSGFGLDRWAQWLYGRLGNDAGH